MTESNDKKLIPFNFPLNGRLITKLDGTLLPDAHFQILENERYNDGGIEGVKGMTKINAAALNKLKVQNGFHFKKTSPVAEDHVFVQVSDDTTSAIYKSDGTSAGVPSVDTFSLFKVLDSTNTCYFSDAPDQSMVFCDGYHNYIYSGDEYRAASVINYDPADTFSNDITHQMSNNLTNASNRYTLLPSTNSADAYTKLLIHANDADGTAGTSIVETSSGKTITAAGNAMVVRENPVKIGTGCGKFDGTGDYLTVPDHADWNFGADKWTIDGQFRPGTVSGVQGICGQYADAATHWAIFLTNDEVEFVLMAGGITYGSYITTNANLSANEFTHIEVVRDGANFYIFINGRQAALQVNTAIGTVNMGDFAAVLEIGASHNHTYLFNGYKDEFRISKGIARHTSDFEVPTTAYSTDSYTKLLLHMDGANNSTTFTDSSGSTHTVTAVADAKIAARNDPKIGLGCLYCDGTGDYFTLADSADWYLADGDFTIDTWIKINSLSAANGICGQYADANNYWQFYLAATTGKATFLAKATTDKASYVTTTWGASIDTWYHIELSRDGAAMYFFVNGVSQTLTETTAISTNEVPDLAAVLEIGACANHGTVLNGYLDEVRLSKGVIRHTGDFTPNSSEYGSSCYTVYIGSTRPLSGIKFYIYTANDTASICSVLYWDGTIWNNVTGLVDGTLDAATGTKTLAKDGLISFDSTADIAKIKVINENVAYYYSVTFDGIDAATTIEMVTVKCPVQDVVDIWDGVPRQMFSFLKYVTSYSDLTTNVYSLDYYAGETDTYADISALTSAQYVYLGFNERITGLKVYLAETNVNTNAAIIYVHYWNGSAWTSVGAVVDGTFVGTKTFNRSGTVSWNAPDASQEFTTTIGNSSKWYYYRLSFSATLSATVYIDNISGIPVQQEIRAYRYPVLWQNRLFLLGEQSNNRNSAIGSSYGTNCVFNGTDSGSLIFGSMRDVNCGRTLFTRYGGSLYENLIVCKNNETYLVDGVSFTGDDSGSGAFVVYQVSGTRGCIAPLTMKQCDTGYEVAPGITKHILAWLSNSGVVMFDSNSIIEISNDIGDRFFADRTYSLNRSLSDKSAGFYDATKGEYHALIPVGSTATYLNEEWVYDVIRKKWFQIKRGAKYLWSGFEVEDSYGNQYIYGGTGDGFIERLEYGTTFDGVGITSKFRFPDSLLDSSWDRRKKIRQIRLVGVCKTTTAQTIAVNHYADGSTTPSTPAIVAIANNKTGRRFYKFARSVSLDGTTHSLEFSITTTDEIGGFDPLFVGGVYEKLGYDVEAE
jgi:hypothetical protein